MNLYILKEKLKNYLSRTKKIKIYCEIWIQITYPMSMSSKKAKRLKMKLYTIGMISFNRKNISCNNNIYHKITFI